MIRTGDKKRIQSCLMSLTEIEKQLPKLSFADRQQILPLCQEMAVEMGKVVEEKIGQGTYIVSLLEQYCEVVYQLYITENQQQINTEYRQIHEYLHKIEMEISQLDAESNEILFLPYKAAMWDCMESVYWAAKEQKDCHVTVMPIPYYNVNPQNEILEIKYEGELFPKEVEITDFRQYDLKNKQPDVIFIHNPYDEYNYVTRVASDYFSKELVKHTQHLVYLPYFVANRNEVASHYCVVPAVKYAWRTFVQSEKIREEYVRYMGRPDNILALGSPKFDQVKVLEKNLNRVPEEWKQIIQDRKVFLLNTHISGIMNRSEEMIKKLNRIFSFFEEQEDICLLWRPHPLSMETAKSLNPDFTKRYLKLIERFHQLTNGVYDESADTHRAIALADAYIGNFSSMVSLYGITGKPIFLLSYGVDHILESEEIQLTDQELIDQMKNSVEIARYLYHERFIAMEKYIRFVKIGKDFCVEERKNRFRELQVGFTQEDTAGQRIWNYINQVISGENLV